MIDGRGGVAPVRNLNARQDRPPGFSAAAVWQRCPEPAIISFASGPQPGVHASVGQPTGPMCGPPNGSGFHH